tara:strand:- start:43 stop:1047 length:1005 start_codon:yes stop_codon:yes gene_type:complete
MKHKIICTLGPSSLNKKIILKLKSLRVDIFRINLSHTNYSNLKSTIQFLKKLKIKNICIDTEGAQVRTTKVVKKIFYEKNKSVKIYNSKIKNTSNKINLYPKFKLNSCTINTTIYIGFNNLALKVVKVSRNFLNCKVISEGYLESNKGVHFSKNIKLPALTEKDKKSINLAMNEGIKFYAMSFVNHSSDILQIRKLIGKKSFLISKIETINSLRNLNKISNLSNALLIDRGDLSRYIELETIPIVQEKIAKKICKKKKQLYVATNLLETMIKNKQPTRAESHDIYSTLKQGVNGLVLAAETAIGNDPVGCVIFLKKCIKNYKLKSKLNILKKIN